jgi:hypothetical protein
MVGLMIFPEAPGTGRRTGLPAAGMVLSGSRLHGRSKANKASFEAPVDGMITEVNPKVREARLLHDDPWRRLAV